MPLPLIKPDSYHHVVKMFKENIASHKRERDKAEELLGQIECYGLEDWPGLSSVCEEALELYISEKEKAIEALEDAVADAVESIATGNVFQGTAERKPSVRPKEEKGVSL